VAQNHARRAAADSLVRLTLGRLAREQPPGRLSGSDLPAACRRAAYECGIPCARQSLGRTAAPVGAVVAGSWSDEDGEGSRRCVSRPWILPTTRGGRQRAEEASRVCAMRSESRGRSRGAAGTGAIGASDLRAGGGCRGGAIVPTSAGLAASSAMVAALQGGPFVAPTPAPASPGAVAGARSCSRHSRSSSAAGIRCRAPTRTACSFPLASMLYTVRLLMLSALAT
jgi:hypothetical protein